MFFRFFSDSRKFVIIAARASNSASLDALYSFLSFVPKDAVDLLVSLWCPPQRIPLSSMLFIFSPFGLESMITDAFTAERYSMASPPLPLVYPHAAGIDIGSTDIFISIDGTTVEHFATFTDSYRAAAAHLRASGITTVAMEATGVYWVALYEILEEAGIEVYLVNGAHVQNVPGRKSDVKDCQWLQQLHSRGLLQKSFIPSETFRQLRTYTRLRDEYIGHAATHVQHMQKALDLMNIKLHHVISQLAGVSGLKVVRAIVAGERDPEVLLALCDTRIQTQKHDAVLAALVGNFRNDQVFALRKALECYDFYRAQIEACEQEINVMLEEMTKDLPPPAQPSSPKNTRHHQPNIPGLHDHLMRLTEGRNPALVTGLSDVSMMKAVAEIGTIMEPWPTAKHFTSWMLLSPKIAQSGKRRRSKRQRGSTRAGQIFREAAMSLTNSNKSALGAFYRHLRARRGHAVAMKATARKLAVMYYNVMKHGVEYVEAGIERYEEQRAESFKRYVNRMARKINMVLVPLEVQPA